MQIEDDILTLVAQGDYLDAARLLQTRRGVTLDEAAAGGPDRTPKGANPARPRLFRRFFEG